MGEPTPPCPDLEVLVDLALGSLAGRERADAVAHLARCEHCRDQVAELSSTAEAVLAAAPAAEPPLGFERAVLDRVLGETPVARARRGPRWVRVAAAAAAVIVVAAAVFAGSRLGGPDRGAATVAEAAMITPSGRQVGEVWRHDGDPSWVFVSVPGWTAWASGSPGDPAGRTYRLVASLDDGTQADLGTISFATGGSWGTSTTVDTTAVRRVAILDDTGRVWCEGEF